MYIQINTARVNLADAEAFVAVADSPELHEAMVNAPGYAGAYLGRSSVDPEEFVSVSIWETAEQAKAFLTGPDYAAILGGVRTMLLGPLDRRGYEVNIEYPVTVLTP